jgi:amidophosphoribosyltransferase
LHYLSLEGLVKATGVDKKNFCLACFDGNYPIEPDLAFHKDALGLTLQSNPEKRV